MKTRVPDSSFCSVLVVAPRLRTHLKGHVGDVNQVVVGEAQHVEEAELCEGSGLDLLDTITIQVQLLQGGEAIKGLLQCVNIKTLPQVQFQH